MPAVKDPSPLQLALRADVPVKVEQDDGSMVETITRSDPWQLGDGTWVILLEGRRGGYALGRVHPLQRGELRRRAYGDAIEALVQFRGLLDYLEGATDDDGPIVDPEMCGDLERYRLTGLDAIGWLMRDRHVTHQEHNRELRDLEREIGATARGSYEEGRMDEAERSRGW